MRINYYLILYCANTNLYVKCNWLLQLIFFTFYWSKERTWKNQQENEKNPHRFLSIHPTWKHESLSQPHSLHEIVWFKAVVAATNHCATWLCFFITPSKKDSVSVLWKPSIYDLSPSRYWATWDTTWLIKIILEYRENIRKVLS